MTNHGKVTTNTNGPGDAGMITLEAAGLETPAFSRMSRLKSRVSFPTFHFHILEKIHYQENYHCNSAFFQILFPHFPIVQFPEHIYISI
ncbi:MAG: hypothetical protein DRI57_21365 [Deltaproteobacteria bacterium]|nr:MAG: hypothetical protein DRI57_21365 [Deltaproteobacteria bacterium]